MPDRTISDVVWRVVTMLVNGDYRGLEKLSDGRRLTADQIAQGIEEYGETLVMPPDNAFEDLDIVEISALPGKQWSVHFLLWTAREGKSDLTLELTVREIGDKEFEIDIDDLHVL
jgi:hypothetical protein